MHKGKLIAEGLSAEVYAYGADHVLKLYHSWWPLEKIRYEKQVCQAVYEAGIASPDVGELIEVEGRHGLIYEWIDGPSIESILITEPARADELARLFAHLHVSLHRSLTPAATGLPSQRTRLLNHIELAARTHLDDARRRHVLEILASLPDGNSVCHGDLNPGNVLVTPDGSRIIDWETACIGSPLADVARTLLALEGAALYVQTEPQYEFLLPVLARFKEIYLDVYLAETKADLELIKAWAIPVAAQRLHEGVEIEVEYLLEKCSAASRFDN